MGESREELMQGAIVNNDEMDFPKHHNDSILTRL